MADLSDLIGPERPRPALSYYRNDEAAFVVDHRIVAKLVAPETDSDPWSLAVYDTNGAVVFTAPIDALGTAET